MSTFGTLKTRIANEIHRSDLSSHISNAVLDAIKHYKSDRFRFNESVSNFNTVIGQEYYGIGDGVPYLESIDCLAIPSGNYPLERQPFIYLEELSLGVTTQARPYDYCFYQDKIRLYPIPDAAYTLRISGVKRLTELSGDSDSNAWTTDAEEMIRCRAKWLLYTHILRNQKEAAVMKDAELEAYRTLKAETNEMIGTGFIQPMRF